MAKVAVLIPGSNSQSEGYMERLQQCMYMYSGAYHLQYPD
jgi:hypothetical protein